MLVKLRLDHWVEDKGTEFRMLPEVEQMQTP